jgi:hypothetical protein
MVENNDNIQQRDENNNKRCRKYNKRKQRRLYALGKRLQPKSRRKRRKKLGTREEGWEKKSKDKDKDKVENAEGKRLMKWNEENGWEVLNGDKQGDEEGEAVIDYGRVNDEAWERVEEFRIGERVESNHEESEKGRTK